MATDIQEKAINRHLRDYGQLIQAEAEKMEILGIETTPSLFDKAREIYFLADQIGTRIKVLHPVDSHIDGQVMDGHGKDGLDGASIKPSALS